MKILTANISLGLRDSNKIINNVRGLAAYHSWGSFLIGVFIPPLRGIFAGPARSPARVNYMRKYENLSATIKLIHDADPDVVVLNEVLPEIHGPKIDDALRDLGFTSVTYGRGAKYPDAYVSTYVASKTAASPIICVMPQTPHPGCGGGIAGLRLECGVSVIGAHMAMGGSALWRSQIDAIARLAKIEQEKGNNVILTGDWNEVGGQILTQESFKKLDLVSADGDKTPTCPTSLPHFLQRSLDHIFIPSAWEVDSCRAVNFGSDHLALLVETLP
jgi:endonuclease/exonuclease/phosphatase family metal-dependent hydrolase